MWNGRSSRHSGRVIIRRVCRLLAQAEFGGSCRLRFSGGEHSPELCIHGGAWEARSSLRKEALGPGTRPPRPSAAPHRRLELRSLAFPPKYLLLGFRSSPGRCFSKYPGSGLEIVPGWCPPSPQIPPRLMLFKALGISASLPLPGPDPLTLKTQVTTVPCF